MTKIAGIVHNSVVDGQGLRTAIFLSGCRMGCPGCHNPQAQSFDYGTECSLDQVEQIIRETIEYGDDGITLTGGHPLEPENKEFSLALAKEAHAKSLTVWLYTGYVFEQISEEFAELVAECDVIVDGPFVLEQRSVELPFRGSANQRIIDVKKTLESKEVVLWNAG